MRIFSISAKKLEFQHQMPFKRYKWTLTSDIIGIYCRGYLKTIKCGVTTKIEKERLSTLSKSILPFHHFKSEEREQISSSSFL